MKVLIVDDEKLVRRGLISMMPWEKYGMEVIGEAMNGSKALECMEQDPADLVFTDLMMPVMSGFDLMSELADKYPRTSVAVLTCHEEFALAQQAIRMGAIDYVVKNDLEADLMDEVLERISRLYRQKAMGLSEMDRERYAFYEQTSGPLPGGTPSNPGLDVKQEDVMTCSEWWNDLKWIGDDQVYELMLEQTRRFRLPLAELKGCVFPALLKIGNLTLSVDYAVEWISRLEQGRHWEHWVGILQEGRNHFRRMLFRGKQAPDIVNGILLAVQYMHAQEELDFDQNEIAGIAHMSRTYFSRSFKEATGKSFQDYVKELRLYKAQQLLLQSDKPIYTIARQIGFKDDKYFSKMFQQRFGLLPSAYRHQRLRL